MAGPSPVFKAGTRLIAEPLIGFVLREFLHLPGEKMIAWVKNRFEDHSQALPGAIALANNRAWQAFELALAGESFLGRITGFFQDGDLKAFQGQIRSFLALAESQFQGQPEGLRVKACNELNRLKQAGHLEMIGESVAQVDPTRFASAAATTENAQNALEVMARELVADCPHLARVLHLAPPDGGPPLLAAAFAFFLRREIATRPELAREITFDQLRMVTGAQLAGFEHLAQSIDSKWDALNGNLGSWFTSTDQALEGLRADLQKFFVANQVLTKADAPLRVTVTSEGERDRLRSLRDRFRALPMEMIDAKLQTLFGDGLAAAGDFPGAESAQAMAAIAAGETGDRVAEAEAAFKEYKAACESKHWGPGLKALLRAIELDERRFRPVPKHYRIEEILGAGAYGVVLKCRNTISFDEDGNELICAVKTFRETDLDRPLKEIFAEANTLKQLNHRHVIRVIDHGYADPEGLQRPFLAMEFFPGVTLEEHLEKNGPLNLTDFGVIFGQIAEALYAGNSNRRPIYHRDLKPANVLVAKERESWQVKVIDFGLAVKGAVRSGSMSIPHTLRATRDQSVTGTIKYAAPEQLGEKPYPVGPHSDVFAFGKSALEALFGTVQPTPRHWKQVPEPLSDLLARCVEEDFHTDNEAEGRFHSLAPVIAYWNGSSPGPSPEPEVTSPSQPVNPLAAPTPPSSPPPVPTKPAARVRQAGERHEITLTGGVKMAFAWCPPGTFLMGSPESEKERRTAEKQHKVTLTVGFWMGIHPVTQAQWNAVMDSNASDFKGDMLPVENVTWEDAIGFCKAVKNQTGIILRLPTEAEWEYAARGGTQTPFYWGLELNGTQANCDGNHPYGFGGISNFFGINKGPFLQKTTPVGQYAGKYPHPWGLTDVIGNVWEWCADWYDENYYLNTPANDPPGPDSGSGRVIRGGGWRSPASGCRVADRLGIPYVLRDFYLGFRLAAGPKQLINSMIIPNQEEGVQSSSQLIQQNTPTPQTGTQWLPANLEPTVRTDKPTKLSLGSKYPKNLPKNSTHFVKTGDRYEIILLGGLKMAFAWCPPGTFLMGSPESEKERGNIEKQHKVTLTEGFWMGIHSVTVGVFSQFVKEMNYKTEAETLGGALIWDGKEWELDPKANWRNPGFAQNEDHPVTCVSWNDSQELCKWVESLTRFPVRLPTEAEWEYAARGGTQTPFYWGSGLNGTYANCNGNHPYGFGGISNFLGINKGPFLQKTTPVGQYAGESPHLWGLTDVIGNVSEWCADWYDENYYSNTPANDPPGPDNGSDRVVRGGSWFEYAVACRVARRGGLTPDNRVSMLGFRLAAGPSGLI